MDPSIVVQIDAEEELRRVDLIAQEGLGVIGAAVLVLVDVGDAVVILVETRDNLGGRTRITAAASLAQAVAQQIRQAIPIHVADGDATKTPVT